MKKCNIAIVIIMAFLVPFMAQAGSTKGLAEKFFSSNNPKLTKTEKAAISIGKRWTAGTRTGTNPAIGPGGSIRYIYGAQQPSIVCAVLKVCDVELQAGERISGIHLGDTVRWMVDPAITGYGPTETLHLIIKPWDVGLETNLIVTTDRRAYHFKLISHRTKLMPKVSFVYPEEAMAKWDTFISREASVRKADTIPQTGEYLGDLSFAYDLDGEAIWKPVRVYNDGRKTIIQMPESMQQTEAPSLLVVRSEGGLFSEDDSVLVNYRVQGDRYIVDQVFDQAILIAGVGSKQDRITIKRRK